MTTEPHEHPIGDLKPCATCGALTTSSCEHKPMCWECYQKTAFDYKPTSDDRVHKMSVDLGRLKELESDLTALRKENEELRLLSFNRLCEMNEKNKEIEDKQRAIEKYENIQKAYFSSNPGDKLEETSGIIKSGVKQPDPSYNCPPYGNMSEIVSMQSQLSTLKAECEILRKALEEIINMNIESDEEPSLKMAAIAMTALGAIRKDKK